MGYIRLTRGLLTVRYPDYRGRVVLAVPFRHRDLALFRGLLAAMKEKRNEQAKQG